MSERQCPETQRLHIVEEALFGKPGEKGIAHVVRDNTVLIDAHIRECRQAREDQRKQAEEAKRESKRQFWAIITTVIGAIAAIVLTKLIG